MGATPKMNRSAKGGARSSLHYGGEGVLIHPPHQGVCGWHGTEEQCVTSGGLAESADGTGESGPISASEMASEALPVVGRLRSTSSAAKATRPSNRRPEWVGEGGRRRWSGRNSEPVSKDGKMEQFHE
jgi:hypothetical protein